MTRIVSILLIAVAAAVVAAFPGGDRIVAPEPAHAASGATYLAPPNYNFEAGPLQVGDGPTNYDFADGGTGWSESGTGTATYSGGVATLSGSVNITSSSFALTSDVEAIKIRYKAGTSALVTVLDGLVGVGSDDLECVNCSTGEWVDKYIGVYTAAQGETVTVRIAQSSGTTEIDWVGTQWIPFQEWTHTSVGARSQPKEGDEGSQIMEVHGNTYSGDFVLQQNRLEFHYAFPMEGDNSLVVRLRRASDGQILKSESFTAQGDPVPLAFGVMSWAQDYVGELVYINLLV